MSPSTKEIPVHESRAIDGGPAHAHSILYLGDAEDGVTIESTTRRRSLKPRSSGWKSLAWTKPAEEYLESSSFDRKAATLVPAKQQLLQAGLGLSPLNPTPTASPPSWDSSRSGGTTGPSMPEDERRTELVSQGRVITDFYQAGDSEGEAISSPQQGGSEPGQTFNLAPPSQTDAMSSGNTETPESATEKEHSGSILSSLLSRENNHLWAQASTQQGDESILDASQRYLRSTHGDQDRDVRQERALSDNSVLENGTMSKDNSASIQCEVSEKDGVVALLSMCSKEKGLPVVQHAASGGSKSRKILRYKEDEGTLVLCGARPPYFKTKITVIDVDRVDAKWCCVVIHIKERPSVRLEVDSPTTATMLRAGILAASSGRSRKQDSGAGGPALRSSHRRDRSESSDIGLSSVRPGHTASKVYDPDAALSVAARLAKELEEERVLASRSTETSEASQASQALHRRTINMGKPAPAVQIVKRSNSMTSLSLSRDASGEHGEQLPPQSGAYDSLPKPRGEKTIVNAEAALRRLRTAMEGRGMAALKRHPNGKGRSRVMLRCRMEAGTIGWVHVLPPFTRKNVPAQDLVGASRSCKEVTINFKHRAPAVFELDRLTDALILEQGFVCLARLIKHAL